MVVVVIWLIFGLLSAMIGSNRGGNGCLYFIGGVLLGPIGLILAFFEGKKCPQCGKKISNDAKLCPYCNYKF